MEYMLRVANSNLLGVSMDFSRKFSCDRQKDGLTHTWIRIIQKRLCTSMQTFQNPQRAKGLGLLKVEHAYLRGQN